MKRIAAVIALLALAFATMMIVSCQSNELVKFDRSAGLNGGFELTDSGYPINWAFSPNPESTESLQVYIDKIRFVEGSNSLRLVSTQDDRPKAFRSQSVPVDSGGEYRIGFSVLNEGCSLRVNRIMTDASGMTHFEAQTILDTSESTTEWVRFEELFTANQGEAYVFLIFLVDGVGTLWCDHVRVEERTSQY
jgi:hypothetical protein